MGAYIATKLASTRTLSPLLSRLFVPVARHHNFAAAALYRRSQAVIPSLVATAHCFHHWHPARLGKPPSMVSMDFSDESDFDVQVESDGYSPVPVGKAMSPLFANPAAPHLKNKAQRKSSLNI